MRSFVVLAALFLAACTLSVENPKLARRGSEAWKVEGRDYEILETYYKRTGPSGNTIRFVMAAKVAAAMLAPDEAKMLALPLIKYARDHRLHERTTIPPNRGSDLTMVGFTVEWVSRESGKVVGDFEVPGGEVTWRLAHPNDP
jgi:hypothetical protein